MHPVTVACKGPCKRILYEGDAAGAPSGDGQQILTDFADSSCPVGGQAGGCPNVTQAVEEQREQEPSRLRQLLRAIRDRAPRTTRVALPALVANTPIEVPITWTPAMPDQSYSVSISLVHGPALLGAIRAAVKPGSLTTGGCTLHVGASRDVADGQAGVHVTGTP